MCKNSKISGVKALPIIKPIKILAGAENIFGFWIGSFSNLMAIEVVKIAPKSHGSGRCKKINKIYLHKTRKSSKGQKKALLKKPTYSSTLDATESWVMISDDVATKDTRRKKSKKSQRKKKGEK